MEFLIVNVQTNTDLVSTDDCCDAISQTINYVANGVTAELFVCNESIWYGWDYANEFMGLRPKTPPTR